MKALSEIDFQGNKQKNVGTGLLATDGVALSQVTAGRFLGVFQIAVTENQAALAIPTAYQSKGNYLAFTEGLLIPPQYLTITATTITVNTTAYYITAGTVTVLVYS